MRQGSSALLPGALVLASAIFVLFFLLKFTFWGALLKEPPDQEKEPTWHGWTLPGRQARSLARPLAW